MSTLTQLRAVASVARQLPGAVLRQGCQAVREVDERNTRLPVVLVHGYAGTDAVWSPLRHALADAGFGHVVSLNYNCFAVEPARLSAELTRLVDDAASSTGAPGVHLIGHSLGGVLIRRAVIEQPLLADLTRTAVTIASPHRGAPLARIAPGRCARAMRPFEVADGGSVTARVRWLVYYSDGDRIVPASSARLDHPGHRATQILIPGCGHLVICRDARLIRSLVRELIRSETTAAPAALCAAAAA